MRVLGTQKTVVESIIDIFTRSWHYWQVNLLQLKQLCFFFALFFVYLQKKKHRLTSDKDHLDNLVSELRPSHVWVSRIYRVKRIFLQLPSKGAGTRFFWADLMRSNLNLQLFLFHPRNDSSQAARTSHCIDAIITHQVFTLASALHVVRKRIRRERER